MELLFNFNSVLQKNLSYVIKIRAEEPELFFGSGAAGARNFAGAGANVVEQAPEPKTGSST